MNKKYSITIGGIVIMVVGQTLLSFGFSEACSNEIITLVPTIVGGLAAYYGRWRQGDITLAGFKKK